MGRRSSAVQAAAGHPLEKPVCYCCYVQHSSSPTEQTFWNSNPWLTIKLFHVLPTLPHQKQSFEKCWCLKWSTLWTPFLGLHWREHRMAAEGESALQSQGLHGPPPCTSVLTWDRGLQEIMTHSLSEWICHTSPTVLLSTNLYYYEKPCWCYTWDVQLCLQLLNRTQIRCFIDAENIFTMDRFLLFYTTSAQLRRHAAQQTLHHLPHLHPDPPVYVQCGCQLQQVH